MTLFENILSKRDLNLYNCLPLWKLHLTENEFEALEKLLREKARIRELTSVRKEVALYFAEWWRRIFNGGRFGHNDICSSLLSDTTLSDALYQAAKSGARALGIQNATIRTENRETDYSLRPILYQGGLPMNWINHEISNPNSSWVRFIKALVWNEQDFSEIQSLGVIAQQDQSIKLFCDQLRKAVDNKTPEELPFSYRNDWWNILTQKFQEAKTERKHKRPFEFKWLFDFNDPFRKLEIRFEVYGPTTLPDEFIAEHHQLNDVQFITISVKCNKSVLYRAEYDERHYCRRTVKYNGAYKVGDEITIEIEETGEVLLTHELDLSDPKLLVQTDDYRNTFTLCDSKKIAYSDCRAIAMDGWVSENVENEDYCIDNEIYKVFFIQQTVDTIIIHNDTESKTFDPQKPLCWTIIDPSCVLKTQLATKEPLYNATEMRFFKGEENKVDNNIQRVKFAAKGSRVWNDRPKLGEIRARIDLGNESVDTVKFINVGKLNISKEASNRDTCDVRITWDGGKVDSTEAVFQNSIWHISKDRLSNIRFVPFSFTPNPGKGEAFTIHICPLFDDFKILGPDLTEVLPNSVIPMVDLQTYSYYLHGNEINLRLGGDSEEQIQYRNAPEQNKLNVKRRRDTDGHEDILHSVPCEGFLSTFFGGTNTIRNLLERNTQPITESIDKVGLYRNRTRVPEVYYFKDFPYRIIQTEDNCLSVGNCVTIRIKDVDQSLALPSYKGALLSIPTDDPSANPIKLLRKQSTTNDSDTATFIISDEMRESQNKQWLVYGDLQGLILPKLIDLGKSLNEEERSLLKRNNIQRIKAELNDATLFDDKWGTAIRWFELISDGRIPASSMLTMVAIADDPVLLEKLALHLYIMHYDNSEDVFQDLNEFQRQMQFLWSWVPAEDLTGFISFEKPYLNRYYYDWLTEKGVSDFVPLDKQTLEMLNECRLSLIQGFKQWFAWLKYDNEPIQNPHPLYTDPKLNAFGDGLQSEEARRFFEGKELQKEIQIIGNPIPKEKWILERRIVHKDIIDGKRNAWKLGDYSPKVTKEIHRSIIYGLKFEYKEQ